MISLLERLVESERLKDEFVQNCSHELRTPLTPIIGWARLMQKRPLSPEQVHEIGESIERNAKRLLDLVSDLLSMKTARGIPERTLTPEEFDMADAVQGLVSGLGEADAVIDIHIDPAAAVVNLYRPYFEAAVKQLIQNAVKFGGSRIEITATRRPEWLRVCVRDNGLGIPEERKALIFRPFVQGDGGPTRRKGGLGVGLFLAKTLVESLGGTLELEFSSDDGSSFCIWLPQRRTWDPGFVIDLRDGRAADSA